MQPRMRAINRLYELLDEYAETVTKSPLTESSQRDYVGFAQMFVRWVDNDFDPGANVRR